MNNIIAGIAVLTTTMERTGDSSDFTDYVLSYTSEDFVYNATMFNERHEFFANFFWNDRNEFLFTGYPNYPLPPYPIALVNGPTYRFVTNPPLFIKCYPSNKYQAIGYSYFPVEVQNKTSFQSAFITNYAEFHFRYDKVDKQWKCTRVDVETKYNGVV